MLKQNYIITVANININIDIHQHALDWHTYDRSGCLGTPGAGPWGRFIQIIRELLMFMSLRAYKSGRDDISQVRSLTHPSLFCGGDGGGGGGGFRLESRKRIVHGMAERARVRGRGNEGGICGAMLACGRRYTYLLTDTFRYLQTEYVPTLSPAPLPPSPSRLPPRHTPR